MKKAPIKFPKPQDVALESINFASYNPRTISAAKMKSLKASLLKHGLVLNLVAQKKGMTLIGGHQRVKALRELCKENSWELPKTVLVTVLDVDDATAKQLNVTLNNVEGEFDAYRLGELYADILPSMTPDDVMASGFADEELREIVDLVQKESAAHPSDDTMGEFAKSVTLSLAFTDTKRRDSVRELIAKRVGSSKKTSGDVVYDLLRGK